MVNSQQPTFNDDVLGLIFFKAGLNDPNAKLQSWSSDENDPCNWTGVKCDPITYRVTELHLDGLSLSGHVGRGLLRLQFLQVLSLSKNNLTGTINSELSHIGSLRVIDLSGNSLSGSIPDEFFAQLGSLKSVSFARNKLTGHLPGSLSSCSTLVEANFSFNRISGQLPSGIWFLRSLQSLDVSGNLIEGEIPEGIGNLYDLRLINFGNNRFSGRIPGDIGSCSLSISLQGNSLRGQVPDWIGELTSLESLDLSANNFSGRIPSLGNLQSLRELNLSMNQLTGNVPSWISGNKLMGSLQVMDLSSNDLYGEIPSKIGVLSSLVFFNMSRNHLFGSIPDSIGDLKTTQVIDLSYNMLNGSIPSEIGGAVSLKELRLQMNYLSGKIPIQIVNCSSLTVLNLSWNKLSGSIPPAVSNLSRLDISALIAIGAAAFIVIGVVAITVLNIHVRSSMLRSPVALTLYGGEDFSCSPNNDPNYGKLVMFSGDADFAAGAHALLKKDCELGRGGFGVVYQTILSDGRSVAIKKLIVASLIKSQDEFEREIKKLGKIRHHNLVALEGYYWTPSLQLLIYEFVSSGSCISTSMSLEEVAYRDPKIGDFGLARLLPTLDRCVLSSKIQSALEVITGKKPVEYMEDDVVVLCDMVRGALEDGRVEECIDGRLRCNFPAEEAIPVIKLGLICASQVPSNRPDMEEVVNILELIQCPSEGQEELE
ncbi:vacuolar sorting receptor family protein [Hibiscus syriacus]|uniref:Vacuolar sorting receptor family protein n=1 Tax=Hibiscus syriacus TaxID=106335 RepID=A0A6A2WRB7_HIBSY|nr:vacuolar sorting receptor family protein [Hibiscus syriacus]